MELYHTNLNIDLHPICSLGIRSTDFTTIDGTRQISMFDSVKCMELEALEFTKDKVIKRYGKGAVVRAVFQDKTAPKE